MNETLILFPLQAEIERKLVELEQVCFDPKADEVKTLTARTRRLQLMAVLDFLNRKTVQL
jgi:hypothetical protein|tara:strand:+ start:2848 stop:3027 length:180 start_codon:yes stop_codon:yes gene_type:complete